MCAEHFNLFNEHVKPAISFSNLVLHLSLSPPLHAYVSFHQLNFDPFGGIAEKSRGVHWHSSVAKMSTLRQSLTAYLTHVTKYPRTHTRTHTQPHTSRVFWLKLQVVQAERCVCVCVRMCVCVSAVDCLATICSPLVGNWLNWAHRAMKCLPEG